MSKVYTVGQVEEMLRSPKILPPLTDDIMIVEVVGLGSTRPLWDEEKNIYDMWEAEYLRRQNTRLRREKILLREALQDAVHTLNRAKEYPGWFISTGYEERILKLTEDK